MDRYNLIIIGFIVTAVVITLWWTFNTIRRIDNQKNFCAVQLTSIAKLWRKAKFVPEDAKEIDDTWQIIWNDGSGNQTKDLKFQNQYLYTGTDKNNIAATSKITAICESTDITNLQSPITNRKLLINNQLYIQVGNKLYDATGKLITTGAD